MTPIVSMPLTRAWLCRDCQSISNIAHICPVCGCCRMDLISKWLKPVEQVEVAEAGKCHT